MDKTKFYLTRSCENFKQMINILNNICIMINKKKILKNYQCYSMYRYLINDRSLKFNEGKNIFELKIEKDLKN